MTLMRGLWLLLLLLLAHVSGSSSSDSDRDVWTQVRLLFAPSLRGAGASLELRSAADRVLWSHRAPSTLSLVGDTLLVRRADLPLRMVRTDAAASVPLANVQAGRAVQCLVGLEPQNASALYAVVADVTSAIDPYTLAGERYVCGTVYKNVQLGISTNQSTAGTGVFLEPSVAAVPFKSFAVFRAEANPDQLRAWLRWTEGDDNEETLISTSSFNEFSMASAYVDKGFAEQVSFARRSFRTQNLDDQYYYYRVFNGIYGLMPRPIRIHFRLTSQSEAEEFWLGVVEQSSSKIFRIPAGAIDGGALLVVRWENGTEIARESANSMAFGSEREKVLFLFGEENNVQQRNNRIATGESTSDSSLVTLTGSVMFAQLDRSNAPSTLYMHHRDSLMSLVQNIALQPLISRKAQIERPTEKETWLLTAGFGDWILATFDVDPAFMICSRQVFLVLHKRRAFGPIEAHWWSNPAFVHEESDCARFLANNKDQIVTTRQFATATLPGTREQLTLPPAEISGLSDSLIGMQSTTFVSPDATESDANPGGEMTQQEGDNCDCNGSIIDSQQKDAESSTSTIAIVGFALAGLFALISLVLAVLLVSARAGNGKRTVANQEEKSNSTEMEYSTSNYASFSSARAENDTYDEGDLSKFAPKK